MTRAATGWLGLAWLALAVLPWYALPGDGWLDPGWLRRYPDAATAPALLQGMLYGRPWLLPGALPLLLPLLAWRRPREDPRVGTALVMAGAGGLAWTALQGLAIDHRGWSAAWLAGLFGSPGPRQAGFGTGAFVFCLACLVLLCHGLAARGFVKGDAFLVSAIGLVVALVIVFVFWPVLIVLSSAVRDDTGGLAPGAFLDTLMNRSIWGLDCLYGPLRCGVAWNTLFLALLAGAGTTVLGLAFALIATRTGLPLKPLLRGLSVLPIITPPFVIGLALILLFGRAGAVSALLSDWLGIPRTRWLYGLPGVLIAQLLAFAPIAFLVLIGVVQGISPSLEEAAQTLRASRWTTFRTVTWPLLRPGVANAFLLGFVESMADFGNPLVLAGNYEVLSIQIFFAVVGAAHDQGRAAVLALVLLVFTLGAFYAQQRWLGRGVYTTVTGKGDAGLPVPLPAPLRWGCYALAVPWGILAVVIYAVIIVGGFVRAMGRDYTPTLQHFLTGFSVERTASGGFLFTGSAWDSFWTTIQIASISAPITAAIGVLTAYLLARQRFAGRSLFEFGTMLSFAIPGTVIGVSYILAFNVPPIELTGTGLILVLCFVFRNMPVGVRAGIAALSQIDRSLDEASLTLGARTGTTMRRIVLPLLRPAIVAALVYSFVRAMTAVSAVIFLVSARYNLATAYIVGRVEAGEIGLAIAYSSVLIVVMLGAILLIQWLVGERRLGRRAPGDLGIQAAGG
ncbi:MAG TPA: iron ABC transporter permease [Methylomirabilota bacterium]